MRPEKRWQLIGAVIAASAVLYGSALLGHRATPRSSAKVASEPAVASEPHAPAFAPLTGGTRPRPAPRIDAFDVVAERALRRADEQEIGQAGVSAGPFEAPSAWIAEQVEPAGSDEETADRWKREALNTTWSQEVERDLEATIAELTFEARVVEVSCRETLCKVQLNFESDEDASWYAAGLGSDDVGSWTSVVDSKPWHAVEAYLPRSP